MPKTSRRQLKNGVWFKRFGPVPEAPCHWCGMMLTFNDATLEHLVPEAAGGGNGDNLAIACAPCNNRRGGEFSKQLQEANKSRLAEVKAAARRVLKFTGSNFADRQLVARFVMEIHQVQLKPKGKRP